MEWTGGFIRYGPGCNSLDDRFDGNQVIQMMSRGAKAQKQAEAQETRRDRELAILYHITSAVSQSVDLNQVLNIAIEEVLGLDVFGGQAKGMLFLLEDGKLRLAAHKGAPEEHPCLAQAPAIGECMCGLAAQRGEVVISNDCYEDGRHSRFWPEMPHHRDICLPLKAHGEVLGVMNLRLQIEQSLSADDLSLLEAISDQIALAIENARLVDARLRSIIEERERIARELHDGLAQVLGYVNNKSATARLSLKKGELQTAENHLLQLEEAVGQVFIDVREAILGLKISGQVDKGLAIALKEFGSQFSRLNELPVDVQIPLQGEYPSLPTETNLHLLRIVQEAMRNARKHASPSRIWISLHIEAGALELSVRDDGVGFAPSDSPDATNHLGLVTMAERAKAIGADFKIQSDPGVGTLVTVRLPLDEEYIHAHLSRG